MEGNGGSRISCEEAQLLICPHLAGDASLADADREALVSHLNRYAQCRAGHQEDKELAALVRRHWPAGTQ